MVRPTIFLGSLAAGLAMTWADCSWLSAAEPISEAEFARLHAELQPTDGEPWRTIPWKIALLDAQRTAASSGRPIFIWAMDGHPLGCT